MIWKIKDVFRECPLDELKESIFQFLRSENDLESSKNLQDKKKKEILFPTFPLLESKFLIDDFDTKTAELEMPIGTNTRYSGRKR